MFWDRLPDYHSDLRIISDILTESCRRYPQNCFVEEAVQFNCDCDCYVDGVACKKLFVHPFNGDQKRGFVHALTFHYATPTRSVTAV